MKTLGALPSFFLTSIRKDFVRQITDVYYTKYHCRAPKPFCKISSLSFIPHLLQIPVDWKSIPVNLFLAKFAVQCDINPSDADISHLYDYWQIAKSSPQFYQFCDQLFTHRIQVRQNLLVSLKKSLHGISRDGALPLKDVISRCLLSGAISKKVRSASKKPVGLLQ